MVLSAHGGNINKRDIRPLEPVRDECIMDGKEFRSRQHWNLEGLFPRLRKSLGNLSQDIR
jgi:hypothetical protein